ncbi:MAG: hypothetical protein WCH84_03935 [Verrucomicrobiota bacterium]
MNKQPWFWVGFLEIARVGFTGSAKLLTASETRHGQGYFFFLDFTATFLPFAATFFLAAMCTSPHFPLQSELH